LLVRYYITEIICLCFKLFKEKLMKSAIVALVASLFAVSAFAQAPAKKEEKKDAKPAATAPAKADTKSAPAPAKKEDKKADTAKK
jgi:hypothetical protein